MALWVGHHVRALLGQPLRDGYEALRQYPPETVAAHPQGRLRSFGRERLYAPGFLFVRRIGMNANERQQMPKPGDDQKTLPPLLPAYAATCEPDGDLSFDRVFNLVLLAHSVMVYGRDNDLSDQQKTNLTEAFEGEGSVVLTEIARELLQVQSIPAHDRIEHQKQCRDLFRKVADEVERSLRSRSVDLAAVIRLNREYRGLLSSAGFLLQLHIQHLKESTHAAKGQDRASGDDWLSTFSDDIKLEAQHKPPDKLLAKSETSSWKPPPDYLNAKEIRDKYGVPRTTLQAWQQQDDVPGGPLAGKLKKAPGRAHTLYYPEKWVIKRCKKWAGNHRD